MGPTNFGTNQIWVWHFLAQTKCWVWKNFSSERKLGVKIVLVRKNLVPKIVGPKIVGSEKNIGSEKMFSAKKIWVWKISGQINIGSEEIWVLKKREIEKILCQKILWNKKWWLKEWSPCTLLLDNSVFCSYGSPSILYILVTLVLLTNDHPVSSDDWPPSRRGCQVS